MEVVEFLNHYLILIAELAILLFEYIGILVIIWAGVRGAYQYIKRDPMIKLNLARALSMGLEFKLGSEILRTVIVRNVDEILIVGLIIVLRAALTLLIHWEINSEEVGLERTIKKHKEHKEQNKDNKNN